MDRANVNGIELEYEVSGSGEPLLLIGNGPIADSFLPLQSEPALTESCRMIRYRQRGQAGGSPPPEPVTFAEHAADAAALLGRLGVSRVHVAGHSTGACVALELAASHPGLVRTLAFLEPPLTGAPAAAIFLERAAPSLAAYQAGDSAQAMAGFLALVSGLDWDTCRAVIDQHVPGGADQALEDADIFFSGYLPALQAWQFGHGRAAAITQPVLSVVGADTDPWFVDADELLGAWFPQLETRRIRGAGHLLHMQQPREVAEQLAGFFAGAAAGIVDLGVSRST